MVNNFGFYSFSSMQFLIYFSFNCLWLVSILVRRRSISNLLKRKRVARFFINYFWFRISALNFNSSCSTHEQLLLPSRIYKADRKLSLRSSNLSFSRNWLTALFSTFLRPRLRRPYSSWDLLTSCILTYLQTSENTKHTN